MTGYAIRKRRGSKGKGRVVKVNSSGKYSDGVKHRGELFESKEEAMDARDFGSSFGKIDNRKIPKYARIGDGPVYYIPVRSKDNPKRWTTLPVIQLRDPADRHAFHRFVVSKERGEEPRYFRINPEDDILIFRNKEDAKYWGPRDALRNKLFSPEFANMASMDLAQSDISYILSSRTGDYESKEERALSLLENVNSDISEAIGVVEGVQDATGINYKQSRSRNIQEAFAADPDRVRDSALKPARYSRNRKYQTRQEHVQQLIDNKLSRTFDPESRRKAYLSSRSPDTELETFNPTFQDQWYANSRPADLF